MKKSKIQMNNIKKQAGWTLWSMLFTMFVIGFFTYIGMNLVPVYSNNSNIKNAMKISVRDVDIRKVTKSQISIGMQKQLLLDGSLNGIDLRKKLKITRNNNNMTLSVEYERTVPLFADISILVNFHPVLECSFSGGCKESNGNKNDKGSAK